MRRVESLKAPWYRLYPGVASLVAAGLYVGITLFQVVDARSSEAITLLYVLPIALMAMTFGAWGGIAAAVAGVGTFAVLGVFEQTGRQLAWDGWVTLALAMLLLGGLLGQTSDRCMHASRLALERERRRLQLAERNHAYAQSIEISDSILQRVATAKWMVEGGDSEGAIELLRVALEHGQTMVAEFLPQHAGSRLSA